MKALTKRIHLLLLMVLHLPSLAGAAGTEGTRRIMLIHGVWQSGPWEQSYQTSLASTLSETSNLKFEISQQFLGIYSEADPDIVARFSNHIAALVEERSIDYVVCVLPAACQLIQPLPLASSYVIAIGADRDTANAMASKDNVTVITSGSYSAIEKTVSHIGKLRPTTRDVHFLSGSSVSDLTYVQHARQIAEQSNLDVSFHFHIAEGPGTLLNVVSQLDPAPGPSAM